jgi:hypothetical protein
MQRPAELCKNLQIFVGTSLADAYAVVHAAILKCGEVVGYVENLLK